MEKRVRKYNLFDPMTHPKSGYSDGEKFWHISDMIRAVKEQKAFKEKIYLNSVNHFKRFKTMNAIEFVGHYERVLKADLKKPIIIHYDGEIVDGYHRIVKALYLGKKWIYGYRIDLTKVISIPDK